MARAALASLGTRYSDSVDLRGPFDAIVIGSGMGGLAAASLLAQRQQRVLLLEQNDLLGGCTQSYERRGYRFNVGVHYVGSVAHPTNTRALFEAVCPGIEWAHLPSIYNRMILGDQSYEIPGGREPYRAMLRDRFPAEAAGIDAYLGAIGDVTRSARGYFGQKALPESAAAARYEQMCAAFHAFSDLTTEEALSRFTSNAELRAVWTANWGDYGLPPSRSSFAMHCMLVKHYMDGASYPKGGAVAFSQRVLPLVEAAGGLVLRAAEVERVLVEAGAVCGIRLVGGREVTAPVVVSNAGAQNTFGRLIEPEIAAATGILDGLAEVNDSYAVVGLNLGLNRSPRELGLTPANIWAHPTSNFDQNLAAHRNDFEAPFPWCFITFPSAKDPDWEVDYPGRATIEMYGYSYFEHFERWAKQNQGARGDDYARLKNQIRQRLLNELERYVPGIHDAVDLAEVSTPLSYERFLRRARGGFMGLEASPARFRQRWLRAPTPVQGLYLSGQDVTSDGVIGALTGGVLAASAVLGEDLMRTIGEQRNKR